jgi:hypothetical protein
MSAANIKFRGHRGTLDEAMKTVVELEPTLAALTAHLGAKPKQVKVEKYMYDDRIGWDTHIVTVDGEAVGFTNGPVH